jgi:ABC-2 type transport system permease protein
MEYYLKSAFMFLKSEMEYKTSFIITAIGCALNTFTAVLATIFLFHKFGAVGGWTLNEVMLTTGVAIFGHSATEMILQGLNHLYLRVKEGKLDQWMVRPRNMLFQVICSDFEANKIGRFLESIILIVYGLCNVEVDWTPYKIFVFLLMIIGVFILFSALLILKGAFCFWTIDGMELMNILQEGGRDLSSYPISIYKDWFQKFFTFVVPFGMVNYFPLVYLLDKQDAPFWWGLTPIMTIPFLGAMLLVWKKGLSSYKSTGS